MCHGIISYEAIIPLRLFNAVQEKMRHRADKHTRPGEKRKEYPFSGKLICACCGKHYRRKITATGPKWVCTTFNTMGKAACPSKQIPEDTLITATEEVIGSTDAIASKITAVRVENDNTLVFCLADGTEIVKRWQDRSRRESRTPEMKEAARRREMERRQQHDTTKKCNCNPGNDQSQNTIAPNGCPASPGGCIRPCVHRQ